ncbi:MAG: hypothetical protein EOL88_08080 [Bacteroidia bacterium]|nr:hypothetical protein [Bacteroidia bacterium]
MLTFDECKKYHYEMWMWLSEHPGSDKIDWPGFDGINEHIPYLCFACYITSDGGKKLKDCLMCPIDWGVKPHDNAPCCDNFTLYDQWSMSCQSLEANLRMSDFSAYAEKKLKQEISSLAKAIANLEWTNKLEDQTT